MPGRGDRDVEANVGKVRVQIGRVITARGTCVVCALLLASTLTACNKTTSSAASAASATGATSAASTGTSSTSIASSGSTSGSTAQSPASSPATTDKSADVSWTPPTANTDGSALTDLAGYTIYYGTSPGSLIQTVNVPNAGASDYVVQGLTQGTWYFAVAAYTNTGLQSSFSTVVSKTIS